MSNVFRITWWEAADLTEHLAARDDIWTQSDENENLWMLTTSTERNALALLFTPPLDGESPFRMFGLQAIGLEWPDEHVQTYTKWLLSHWTTYRQRAAIARFLVEDLSIESTVAEPAAIAIEALDWTEDDSEEPLEPVIQEHLFPGVPQVELESPDPFHIGTYLLNGGIGWIKLRLVSGMIRTQLSLRGKDGKTSLLEGFTRPTHGSVAEVASALGGWKPKTAESVVEDAQPVLPEETA